VLASGSRDGTIILWDFEGRELGRLRGHTSEVRALAFSPDGRMLLSGAVGSEGYRLLLWHVDSGILVFRFEGCTDRVRSVAISENGLRAVSGSDDGIVRVWRLPALDASRLLESVRTRRWTRPLTDREWDELERDEFGRVSWMLKLLRLGGSRP
jgi:WD40 repeat protein